MRTDIQYFYRTVFSLSQPLVAKHRLQTRRLSSCDSRAQLLRGMWALPRPGLEPVSPALTGGFSTTAPPGKPRVGFLNDKNIGLAIGLEWSSALDSVQISAPPLLLATSTHDHASKFSSVKLGWENSTTLLNLLVVRIKLRKYGRST